MPTTHGGPFDPACTACHLAWADRRLDDYAVAHVPLREALARVNAEWAALTGGGRE